MSLALYRRHRRDCKADHKEELRTSEYDERKKGWKRCERPIIASGTLQKYFRPQTTGEWEWTPARAIAGQWEAAGTWDKIEPEPEAAPTSETPPERTTILDATEGYLAKCKNRSIQPTTLAKYRTFVNQLCAYAADCGYLYLDQLTVADMDRFYASWKDGIRAKAKKLERLKSFVKFCQKREWINKNIAEDLDAPEGSSVTVAKSPFTDDELNRLFAGCDAIGPAQGRGRRNWSGEDAKDFIFLSIYTGLRISDVATFDITKRLHGNDVFLRMHKTRKPLYTWIPDWLVARLQRRQKQNGSLIFRCGVTLNMKQLTDIWRNKRLKKVFEIAGPFEEKPTPHRFRHTFVRILFEKGVPIPDIAELAGDTDEVIRKHYAKFVPERQARLTKILREAFEDKPKPDRPCDRVGIPQRGTRGDCDGPAHYVSDFEAISDAL